MPKRTWTLIVIFVAAYGALVFIVRSSPLPDSTKLLLIGGHTVLYLSVVFAELSLFRQHFGVAGDWIRSLANVGRAAKKHELYRAMGNALGYLSDYAYVTYFNNKGPEESGNPAEEQYHSQFRKAIVDNRERTFRRIIALLPSDTVAKRKWVVEEIEFAGKHDNYLISFIATTADAELPLNVQIFDRFVFLIDPNRNNEDTLPRDIHFLSEEIADIWFRYYRSIWDGRTTTHPPEEYLAAAREE